MSKYRLSFVTNSSSSSYICDVCDNIESGWDLSLSDAGMYECENGHRVCEDHIDFSEEARDKVIMKYLGNDFDFEYYIKQDDFREKYGNTKEEVINSIKKDEDLQDDFMSDYMEIRDYLPAELCPICNLDSITEDDKLYYLLKKNNIDIKDLEETIRKEFKTHDELKKYIKEK